MDSRLFKVTHNWNKLCRIPRHVLLFLSNNILSKLSVSFDGTQVPACGSCKAFEMGSKCSPYRVVVALVLGTSSIYFYFDTGDLYSSLSGSGGKCRGASLTAEIPFE